MVNCNFRSIGETAKSCYNENIFSVKIYCHQYIFSSKHIGAKIKEKM